jgi:hypothetical protein
MVSPELRHIVSPDLEPPALPAVPADCAVHFQAVIGPRGGEGAEAFAFIVATPAYLQRMPGPTWGRGHLIVPEFDWTVVVQAIAQLLARCARPTWDEVAAQLDRELHRQHEDGGARA